MNNNHTTMSTDAPRSARTKNTKYIQKIQNTYKIHTKMLYCIFSLKKEKKLLSSRFILHKNSIHICSFYVKAIFEKRNLKFFISKKKLSAPVLLNWFKLVYELAQPLSLKLFLHMMFTHLYTTHKKSLAVIQ